MPLYDQRGQPIDLAALKTNMLLEELSRSGGARTFAADHPSAGLTPQRLAHLLREAEDNDPRRYFGLAEEMEEKDLHYLSVLNTRKRQVAQLEITVEAASDDKADQKAADLVRELLDSFDEQTLFDMLDAVGKGISLTEIIWETSGKAWMPVSFEWVDPRLIDFDDLTRREPMLKTIAGRVALPPWKFVVLSLASKSGLPIRGGLARAAAWAYLFKNFDIKDWVRFAEAYGQPLRVGKFHAGATEAEKRSLLRSVAALGSDAAAIIPQSMAIEFIEAKSQGTAGELYKGLAEYLDQQISKAVLGQTATTDAIAGGHAVGKEHNQVREDIERSDAQALARALNHGLVRPVVDLNLGPPAGKRYPKIAIGRPDQADAKLMIEAVEKLTPFGFRVGQSAIRQAVGLKEPEADDEVFSSPSTAAEPAISDPSQETPSGRVRTRPQPSVATRRPHPRPYSPYSPLNGIDGARRGSQIALAALGAPERDGLDDLADQLIREVSDPEDEMIRTLQALVDDPAITSLQELGRRLLALQPALTSERLAIALGDAMALAELAGRADIADGV